LGVLLQATALQRLRAHYGARLNLPELNHHNVFALLPCDLTGMDETPFATIESAEEFLQLLQVETQQTLSEIQSLADADAASSTRRQAALRLVTHKLNQLESHTAASLRILNDLRSLRTLLMPRR
jgi:hypothetical protein